MTQDTTSYIEMLRKFGSDLGLPKLDVDKLIEAQKKNIDALSESARVAAQGAQSVAQKQREVLDAALRRAPRQSSKGGTDGKPANSAGREAGLLAAANRW